MLKAWDEANTQTHLSQTPGLGLSFSVHFFSCSVFLAVKVHTIRHCVCVHLSCLVCVISKFRVMKVLASIAWFISIEGRPFST